MMQISMNVRAHEKSSLARVNAATLRVHIVAHAVQVTGVMEIQKKTHATQTSHSQQSLPLV
jgi:hypothetical protein